MKKIKIDLDNITKEEINTIAAYFKFGKVIAYPTDTIYGLGCLATDKKAINKIYKIKQRSKNKPLLILASSYAMLKKYCYINKLQYEYLKNIWPSPISVVLKKKKILPEALSGGINSVAVRLSKSDFLIKIIRRVGKPIVSTSLNISGHENIVNVDNLEEYFRNLPPDLLINMGALKGKPSELIDIRDINHVKILRK